MLELHLSRVGFVVMHLITRLRSILSLPVHVPGDGPFAGEVLRTLGAQGSCRTAEGQEWAGRGQVLGVQNLTVPFQAEPGCVTLT